MRIENERMRAALRYARPEFWYPPFSWAVVPFHNVQNGRCSCGRPDCPTPGEHPRTPNGLHDATRDTSTIRQWWEEWPDASIGIATGSPSNLLVLDTQISEGAAPPLVLLALEAETVYMNTEGGRRLFFKAPAMPVPGQTDLAPGLSAIGEGESVVVPPSLDGFTYADSETGMKWEFGPAKCPLADAPAWLLLSLVRPDILHPSELSAQPRGWLMQALTGVEQGERNFTAARLTGLLLARGMSKSEVEGLMLAWNQYNSPPLPEDEVRGVVRSISKCERRKAGVRSVANQRALTKYPSAPPPQAPLVVLTHSGCDRLLRADFPAEAFRGPFADYRDAVARTTEASDILHWGALFTAAGIALGRTVSVFSGMTLYPNSYTLLVGPTSTARKTTASRHACGLVATAELGVRLVYGIASAEGFLQSMYDPGPSDGSGPVPVRTLFVLDEIALLYKKARQEHVSNLIPVVTKAYDCPPKLDLPTRQHPLVCQSPTPSILAATTREWLVETSVQDTDIMGGFANRFLYLAGEPKPAMPFPKEPDAELIGRVTEAIYDAAHRYHGTVLGFAPEARAVWEPFYIAWHGAQWPSEFVGAMMARLPSHALKVALVFAALEGADTLSAEVVKAGIEVARYSAGVSAELFGSFQVSAQARLEHRVKDALTRKGPLSPRQLAHALSGRVCAGERNRAVADLLKGQEIVQLRDGRLAMPSVDAVDTC